MYHKTLIALDEHRSFASHATNLGKIAARTEDAQLRALLDTLISALSAASLAATQKHRISKPGILIGAENLLPPIAPLVIYCRTHVKDKKPEWQVLAERHGWTPPAQ